MRLSQFIFDLIEYLSLFLKLMLRFAYFLCVIYQTYDI